MTALSIVQNACTRLGVSSPSAVFTSTDLQIVLLRNLMNQEGEELARGANFSDYAWKRLIAEQTFTATAAYVQTGAVPTDFNYILSDTFWNRTLMRQCRGPLSPEQWQQVMAIPTGSVDPWYRFRGTDLMIYPTPTAGHSMAYEYVIKNWCASSGGTAQSAYAADTDTSYLEERLITLGIIWRFQKQKGLDYAEEFRTYQIEVGKVIARDGGRKIASLSGPLPPRWRANIPESSWAV